MTSEYQVAPESVEAILKANPQPPSEQDRDKSLPLQAALRNDKAAREVEKALLKAKPLSRQPRRRTSRGREPPPAHGVRE